MRIPVRNRRDERSCHTLGQEEILDFRPGQQGGSHVTTRINAQVLFDSQPALRRKGGHHLLQQLDGCGTIASVREDDGGLAVCRFNGAIHPEFGASPIVWCKGGSQLCWHPRLTGISLDRQRSPLIDTDEARPGQRRHIGPNDGPLFSTNSGSCRSASWNQLVWRFHAKPSSSSHSQIVERERWSWHCSHNANCRRSSVHNANGYPSPLGFCTAKSSTWLRTSSVWAGGRPAFGRLYRPATPSALKRFKHSVPEVLLPKPTRIPARAAGTPGWSSRYSIGRARFTTSCRACATRRFSAASLALSSRNLMCFGLVTRPFSALREGYQIILIWRSDH